MTTLTFSNSGTTPSKGNTTIRDFLVSWFQATPAFLVFQILTNR